MKDICVPKVSVVIPIYNAEKSLKKCIESVLVQSLVDIEVICVDDGSTDGSLAMLEKYQTSDERVRVLSQENKGPMSARKFGLSEASAKYVTFVDSDDYVDAHMYEVLYGLFAESNADIVTSGYYIEGNYVSEQYDGVEEGLYEGEQKKYLLDNSIYVSNGHQLGISGSLCSKMYKTSILKNVFSEISDDLTFSEDKICTIRYLLECGSVYVCRKAFYHYVIGQNSLTHKSENDYLIKVNEVYNSFIKMYDHPNFTPVMRQQAEMYITEMLYKGINSRLGFANKNLLWLDPYWMEEFAEGTKFALYGAGDLGRAYLNQIENHGGFSYVGCIDFGYERLNEDAMNPQSPNAVKERDYDYILITIKNSSKAEEVRKDLINSGIPEEKIKWFDQTEIFWKFAKYNWKKLK